MKNYNEIIGNRTRNFAACSEVSVPTAPPLPPYCKIRKYKTFENRRLKRRIVLQYLKNP